MIKKMPRLGLRVWVKDYGVELGLGFGLRVALGRANPETRVAAAGTTKPTEHRHIISTTTQVFSWPTCVGPTHTHTHTVKIYTSHGPTTTPKMPITPTPTTQKTPTMQIAFPSTQPHNTHIHR